MGRPGGWGGPGGGRTVALAGADPHVTEQHVRQRDRLAGELAVRVDRVGGVARLRDRQRRGPDRGTVHGAELGRQGGVVEADRDVVARLAEAPDRGLQRRGLEHHVVGVRAAEAEGRRRRRHRRRAAGGDEFAEDGLAQLRLQGAEAGLEVVPDRDRAVGLGLLAARVAALLGGLHGHDADVGPAVVGAGGLVRQWADDRVAALPEGGAGRGGGQQAEGEGGGQHRRRAPAPTAR